ncbi:MAG: hypothetical protein AAFV53_20020 [Myxococcota bacterium]
MNPLLFPILGVLIGVLVYAVHWLGGSAVAVLADDAHIIDRFAQDYPDRSPLAVQVSDDRRAALLWFGMGQPVGIIWALGSGFVTRQLGAGSIRRVNEDDGGLQVRLNDFSSPTLRVRLQDGGIRQQWAQRLRSLDGGADGHPRLAQSDHSGDPDVHHPDRDRADGQPVVGTEQLRDA